MSEKTKAQALKEALLMDRKNGGIRLPDAELTAADDFCEGYKTFLNDYKTEREIVSAVLETAKENGYSAFDPNRKQPYPAGTKVYLNQRNKAVLLAVIGSEPIANGVRIAAAHIDSPRVDLKPNPLYESEELALFKTHYYGGIKKYQWTAIPLSLRGVICKKDGTTVTVNLGEDANDPQFVITDLLPHLSAEQYKRTLNQGIKGEELNILIGSRPFKDDKASELVKLNIMRLINEKYDIVEEDFLSAELMLVPAFRVSDIGFDRSMIGGYGQDDRVCAYTALEAIYSVDTPKNTVITVLADKEEVGSDGNTGMQSAFLKDFIGDLARQEGLLASDVLRKSSCLSADVNAGYDPTYPDVLEKKNAAFLNYGVVVTKYTGSGGKGGTSDASAELMGKVRAIFDDDGIIWQTGELGKVDFGGGGTVAKYIANLDVDVVDVGVPVLSMHSPFETTAKIDVYMAFRAFKAYFGA